jgi:GNAT superfamily N-acetyltransferase
MGGDIPEKVMSCLFLNVNKDYAGRGIGKVLAKKSEELARSIGVSLLQVRKPTFPIPPNHLDSRNV